jgi:Uma2 family endonuclease
MTQALPQLVTLDEFLDWYPDGDGRYELIDGLIVEMQPTGHHGKVSGFIVSRFNIEIERSNLISSPQAVLSNRRIPIDQDTNRM